MYVCYRFGCDANGGSWGARALRELGHALQETAEKAKAQTSTSLTSVQSGHWNAPIGLSKVSDPGDIYIILYIYFTNFLYCKQDNMIYTYTYTYIYIYFYSSSKMMFEMVWSFFLMKPFTFSIKWFVWHFKARPEKPHRKVSQIRPQKQAMGAPAAAGQRPGETVVFCNSKICKKSFFELQKSLLWRKSSVVTFSRSRMPTIWKSLLALQLYFDMPRMHRYMHRKKKNYMS